MNTFIKSFQGDRFKTIEEINLYSKEMNLNIICVDVEAVNGNYYIFTVVFGG